MRSAILFAVLPAALVSAEFVARGDGYGDGSTGGSCNTGSIQCCNTVQDASSTGVSQLAGLLGIALGSITGLVGLNCSPLSILGVGGNSCSAQPVCCTGNSFSGLISLGCNPINLNL
ncbi:hypothetical protein NP233_g13033 [Leucocoprinus birnbaumii]|uniref:Hydrophobin n=1 Tax=Leucocoprinus birnbaumii TaxID=56174 RepID=A0AAD5YMI8_9AGAR|nr:hypothetical protein NP233_g13033 [Leucocoprinus birnbaumii]